MSTCTRCGALFTCAVADGSNAPCWCMALPALAPVPGDSADAACWCPGCLQAELARRQAAPPGTGQAR